MEEKRLYPNLTPRKAFWGQRKRSRDIALTDEAVAGLDELAKARGLSRAELVERIGRRIIALAPPV